VLPQIGGLLEPAAGARRAEAISSPASGPQPPVACLGDQLAGRRRSRRCHF
jgi:hypothetical protein